MWLFPRKPKTPNTAARSVFLRRTEITVEREIVSTLSRASANDAPVTTCPACGTALPCLIATHPSAIAGLPQPTLSLPADAPNQRGDA